MIAAKPPKELVIRFTERDAEILYAIGEMYTYRTDDIAAKAGTGETRTLQLIRRYRAAGLVETGRLLYGEPAYHWLTRKGLKEVGLPFKASQPSALMLRHHHGINVVRRMLEASSIWGDSTWISERWLRNEARSSAHIPDGLVLAGARRICIELELTQKSADRQAEIAKDLLAYDEVWLFTAPGIHCNGFAVIPILRTKEVQV